MYTDKHAKQKRLQITRERETLKACRFKSNATSPTEEHHVLEIQQTIWYKRDLHDEALGGTWTSRKITISHLCAATDTLISVVTSHLEQRKPIPRTIDETAECGCNGDWQALNCLICLDIEMSQEAGQLPYWECSEEHDYRVDDLGCGGGRSCCWEEEVRGDLGSGKKALAKATAQ